MNKELVLSALALSALVSVGSAKALIVGQNQGGWTLGVKYGTLNAAVGDSLVSRRSHTMLLRLRIFGTSCLFSVCSVFYGIPLNIYSAAELHLQGWSA